MPASYKHVQTPAPIQHRPPVIPVSVTAADHLALLSAQDGFVRGVDANSGDLLWTSNSFGMLQAGPAASFVAFGAARNLVFVGTRNAGQENVFAAIKAENGGDEWEYQDDDGGQGLGIVNGSASVDYSRGRVYFASHERASGANTIFAPSARERRARLAPRDRERERKPGRAARHSLRCGGRRKALRPRR